MTILRRLNERFERIERAYKAALGSRDPASVNVIDLLPAIFAAIPDTSTNEIADALRWSARKDLREADKLEGPPR
jgi:hypothetical protein